MHRLAKPLIIAALLVSGVATAAPVVDVSDSWVGNVWPGPNPPACASVNGALPPLPCGISVINTATSPGTPPAPGLKLVRSNYASLSGDALGDSFAVSYADGIIGDAAFGRGPFDILAESRYRDKRIYTGLTPVGSYIVGFKIDQLTLDIGPGGSIEQRRSDAGFTILRGNNLLMQLNWGVGIDTTPGAQAGDFINTPAPFVATSVSPGTLPIGSLTATPDVAVNLVSPGANFLLDLGPMLPGQKFSIDYQMFCRAQGNGFGTSFCSIGDPFAFGSGEGIDWGGLSVSAVPTPAALALFGLGALALAGRVTARRRAVAG
jgi:hypothetical protein